MLAKRCETLVSAKPVATDAAPAVPTPAVSAVSYPEFTGSDDCAREIDRLVRDGTEKAVIAKHWAISPEEVLAAALRGHCLRKKTKVTA